MGNVTWPHTSKACGWNAITAGDPVGAGSLSGDSFSCSASNIWSGTVLDQRSTLL